MVSIFSSISLIKPWGLGPVPWHRCDWARHRKRKRWLFYWLCTWRKVKKTLQCTCLVIGVSFVKKKIKQKRCLKDMIHRICRIMCELLTPQTHTLERTSLTQCTYNRWLSPVNPLHSDNRPGRCVAGAAFIAQRGRGRILVWLTALIGGAQSYFQPGVRRL